MSIAKMMTMTNVVVVPVHVDDGDNDDEHL